MIQYFKPSFWRHAVRDPITWLAIAVDLVPVFMVFAFGWRAEALVLLYWAENVVIGGATILRLGMAGIATGCAGIVMAVFMIPFFMVHYGMFCFGHGVFVFDFAKNVDDPMAAGLSPFAVPEMLGMVAVSWPGMTIALVMIGIYQLIAVANDYWPRVGAEYPTPIDEMFAPYGRIVTLHIAIILGAFLMMALGDPMLGVFLLIVIRILVSILGRAWRDQKKDCLANKGAEAD